MVSTMFQRWPHLGKQQVNSDDALTLWKTRLRTYFKNARQRLSHIAEVAAKRSVYGKRKESFEEECNQELKRQRMLWGVPNFMTEYPDGEDNRTTAVLVTSLQKLHKLPKDKQDKALIKRLMDSTFSCRRKALVNDFVNVQTIDYYPFICNEEEVNLFYFIFATMLSICVRSINVQITKHF